MNFFKRLVDMNDPLSTKLFLVLVCLCLLVVMVIANVIFDKVIQSELALIVASVLTAGIGASLLDRKIKNNNEPDA